MVFEAVLECIRNGENMGDLSTTLLSRFDQDIDELKQHLKYAGFIPEEYNHDSSEEKYYAKYCEVLICSTLRHLGFESELIEARGNRADVVASCNEYTVISDAKAFRMTRTALNPKDYKINAMDTWRAPDNAEYAFLVSSIFPGSSSRLWAEAVGNNVTILNYAHLYHMLENREIVTPHSLRSLLDIEDINLGASNQNGTMYWREINRRMNEIAPSIEDTQDIFRETLSEQMERANQYWENRRDEILNMDDLEAKQLIIDDYYNISNKLALIQNKHFFF